jgi:HSP20 family protein
MLDSAMHAWGASYQAAPGVKKQTAARVAAPQQKERNNIMENTNMDKPTRRLGNRPVTIGLAMLAVGVLMGAGVMKYAARGSSANDKSTGGTEAPSAATSAANSSGASGVSQFDEWNPFREMRQMESEMDRLFQRSFERLRLNPQMRAFKEEPGYSLKLDVRDLKDRIEVRASLPGARASDVKVNLEHNQILKVAVSQNTTEKTQSSSAPTVTEWGRYEQTIDLPAPVKSEQMKIERKDHDLVITLPKS